jgi:cytochrome c-type biogenesis protein CcmE
LPGDFVPPAGPLAGTVQIGQNWQVALNKGARVVLSALVILASAAGFLYYTTVQDAEYYKHVDEVMANPSQWYGKSMSLHGFVDGQPLQRADSLDYRFQVKAGPAVVQARYTGVVPDTFKEGSEVVLRGRLTPDGFHVDPNGVMAKCPSKYEARKAGGQ